MPDNINNILEIKFRVHIHFHAYIIGKSCKNNYCISTKRSAHPYSFNKICGGLDKKLGFLNLNQTKNYNVIPVPFASLQKLLQQFFDLHTPRFLLAGISCNISMHHQLPQGQGSNFKEKMHELGNMTFK